MLLLKRSAQEKAQAQHAVTTSNFKSLLKDRGDITSTSRWSKVGLCQRVMLFLVPSEDWFLPTQLGRLHGDTHISLALLGIISFHISKLG